MLEKDKNSVKKAKLTAQKLRFCEEYVETSNSTEAAIAAGYSKKTAAAQAARLLADPLIKKEILRLRPVDEYYRTMIRHNQFATAYIDNDFNGRKAYKAVFDNDPDNPMGDDTATACASRLLRNANVKETIEKAVSLRQKRMEITKDAVLARYNAWASSDISEVVEWETVTHKDKDGNEYKKVQLFPKVDSKDLTPEQASLIEGISLGKDGFKISMVSKKGANDMLAKHLGIDKLNVELSGKDGGPIKVQGGGLSALLLEAENVNPGSS